MSFRAKVTPNPDVIAFRLGQALVRAEGAVGTAVTREAINLVAYVKENKLTDNVLKVQTGRLRRSITYRVEKRGSEFIAYVGTNVKYARAHELGFSGTVSVKAHVVKESKRKMTMAFGKPMKNPRTVTVSQHTVKQHSMKMNLKARPFLQPSLAENTPRIQNNLRAAVIKALKS